MIRILFAWSSDHYESYGRSFSRSVVSFFLLFLYTMRSLYHAYSSCPGPGCEPEGLDPRRGDECACKYGV